MGSKSRIAKHIVPIIQEFIEKTNAEYYIEPFVGGANIIDKVICKNKIGNDVNSPLIQLLIRAQKFEKMPDEISKKEYAAVRSNPQNYEEWYVGCVGFLASYNGRYFDGGYAKPGYEKTKSGERLRDYYREAKENLITQAQTSEFQNIKFCCHDYLAFLVISNPKNYIIYCDPPYQGTKQFSNSKNFNYEQFWNVIRILSKENIVLVSELNAPDDFECIWQQDVSRSIKSKDKGVATEKLFQYKSE